MKTWIQLIIIVLILASLNSSAFAEEKQDATGSIKTDSKSMVGEPTQQAMQEGQSMMGQGGEMGMENMPMGEQCSPMCRGMMEKEMAVYPWKVAGGVVVGILVITALALLVVFEVLWARLLAARLKKERG